MTNPQKYLIFALTLSVTIWGVYLGAQGPARTSSIDQFHTSLIEESKGDIDASLMSLMKTLPAESDNYLINLRLGWLYYLKGDYAESVQFYDIADALSNKQSVEALLGLRLPYAAQENWSEVETIYKKILVLDPNNYEANLRLGQINLNRGDYQKAVAYFATVRRLYPADYESNLSSAWNYYKLNDVASSRSCFETALMLSPGDTSATRGLTLVR